MPTQIIDSVVFAARRLPCSGSGGVCASKRPLLLPPDCVVAFSREVETDKKHLEMFSVCIFLLCQRQTDPTQPAYGNVNKCVWTCLSVS